MKREASSTPEPVEPASSRSKPIRKKDGSARRRKQSSSDRQFLLVVGLVVFGGGFLVARFLLELPVWQSILVAPIAFLAVVLALVTWSWFTPAGRR